MTSLEEILVTPLRRIATVGGDVMHAMRNDDAGYGGFGEAYFSWIVSGAVKAWKRHRRMTLNLVVPIGQVRFVFAIAGGPMAGFRSEEIGIQRYVRLTVPPGVWFGFQGRADGPSLVLNIADIGHDPDEAERRAIEEISFNWFTS